MIKIIYLTIVSGILFLSSCQINKGIPKAIIAKDTMALILQDIHIIESGLSVAKNNGLDANKYIAPYYKALLKKYKISENRLKNSVNYYGENPQYLDEIYQNISPELEKQQMILRSTPH